MPTPTKPRLVPIALGWARNSINTTIYRKNALVTHEGTQYAAFYDADGYMTLAKRRLRSKNWMIHTTGHVGNTADAHNGISIAVDGAGYLHVSYDHHNHPLRYRRGVRPGALALGEALSMTGEYEDRVTYPQFYNLPDGDLLFLYRDGMSGNGNLMLNHYHTDRGEWTAVARNFVDGEGQRNAYPNLLALDAEGRLHLTWCWRETPDVATNHDLCYACSADGGHTWMRSNGQSLDLPITMDNAEYARRIPQRSKLINQCSMTVDGDGHPIMASYWQPAGSPAPQYHIVYHDGARWLDWQINERTLDFALSGPGSRRIPISRPLVLVGPKTGRLYVVFRDEERGGGVSVAVSSDPRRETWRIRELTTEPLGFWEPAADFALWQAEEKLHLLVQYSGQGDRETLEDVEPQMVSVLEWTPPRPRQRN